MAGIMIDTAGIKTIKVKSSDSLSLVGSVVYVTKNRGSALAPIPSVGSSASMDAEKSTKLTSGSILPCQLGS